jgi:hypothetical protein
MLLCVETLLKLFFTKFDLKSKINDLIVVNLNVKLDQSKIYNKMMNSGRSGQKMVGQRGVHVYSTQKSKTIPNYKNLLKVSIKLPQATINTQIKITSRSILPKIYPTALFQIAQLSYPLMTNPQHLSITEVDLSSRIPAPLVHLHNILHPMGVHLWKDRHNRLDDQGARHCKIEEESHLLEVQPHGNQQASSPHHLGDLHLFLWSASGNGHDEGHVVGSTLGVVHPWEGLGGSPR